MADAIAHAMRPSTHPVPVAVSAMEGAGWMSVLAVRDGYAMQPIPFVNIRAAAGYTHEPVFRTADAGDWRESGAWLTASERLDFERLAQRRASQAATKALLQFFQRRTPLTPTFTGRAQVGGAGVPSRSTSPQKAAGD